MSLLLLSNVADHTTGNSSRVRGVSILACSANLYQDCRSEVIVGRTDWGPTADIWSAACVIFELLTAEYLFDPQSQGDVFGKDDDHMAQIIELLGDFDSDAKFGGRFSRELFDSTGALRYIRSLKPWPLRRVMIEKYLWSEVDAEALCQFLEPMLIPDHHKRKHARDLLDHAWLEVDHVGDDFSAS